jgi:D-beta-D-heptose 7-phosphate kinase/D-beta-D-heptose 1-phosphate adenosyltransferase
MIESEIIQPQTSFNVLLIGDSCVDTYCYGSCDRLSPEAPVPVLKFTNTVTKPGMAANVKENLEAFGINVDFITNNEEIQKVRYIDEKTGQHLLRVDYESPLVPWSGRLMIPLESYNAIVISDYNKGFLTYEHIEQLRQNFDGPIFLDTKKTDLIRFDGCVVKINETEYKNRTSVPENLIVTLGSDGAMHKHKYQEAIYPTKKVEVTDVCGAGDTFLAALTFEHLRSKNFNRSITFANQCSAITVQHRGVYSLTEDDIDSIII